MNLSWHHTGQVRLWSRLTYFYMSYCPLQRLCFPDFSLSSFDILSWNFIYKFVLTSYRSSSTLVAFDLLLHELLPFAKIMFSGLFFVIFRHIELKFHICICLDMITGQMRLLVAFDLLLHELLSLLKFLFFRDFSLSSFDILSWNFIYVFVLTSYRSSTTLVAFDLLLHELLPLLKFRFRDFLCHLSTCWVEISYMNLSWHNTGQVRLWSRLTDFYMSYCPFRLSTISTFSYFSYFSYFFCFDPTFSYFFLQILLLFLLFHKKVKKKSLCVLIKWSKN